MFLSRPDGASFTTEVPNEFHEEVSPRKGDIVSFSYQNFSKNELPADPHVYRIREDLNWKDVVQNYLEQASQPNFVNGMFILQLFFAFAFFFHFACIFCYFIYD